MLKQLIRSRLYSSSPEEVVQYGRKYGVQISRGQAERLLAFIKKESIDPFSERDRSLTFKYVEKTIGQKEAQQADQLLKQLAKQYNLDHLL
ncbi:DUF2624 family protein [Tenuibacillus multivorans]|uniref:DUF2624 domain-containing protein n=1 Tax=Tenuibacillus multivorans TaxID=237069 RepID=A0A1G9ZB37_9BACI|nr:DUF2624 family protein [Tenuibacillus multivorans]GEL78295.1 hypothetical protein TMU01_25300 [Tenuibacillus multivorans]SDN18678.1 Protein of unknown function [Tenuibacillus multivorans]